MSGVNDPATELRALRQRIEQLAEEWEKRARGLAMMRSERQIGMSRGIVECAQELRERAKP